MRVFLNLKAGLDRLGIAYTVNDFPHARRHLSKLCCILGKRDVLDRFSLPNPLMVGPCCHSHSLDAPDLANRPSVRRILVPGEWMRRMCTPLWGERVHAWPVGIDTDQWAPFPNVSRSIDFILYNKIHWDRAHRETELLSPIRTELQRRGLSYVELRYGAYRPDDYRTLLSRARGMIFVSEHETQGLAYQEALSCNVPVLAWNREGEWLDPDYYPHRVRFSPVSSVPYWSERCGDTFTSACDFTLALDRLLHGLTTGRYAPREYILQNLSLEAGARAFMTHVEAALHQSVRT